MTILKEENQKSFIWFGNVDTVKYRLGMKTFWFDCFIIIQVVKSHVPQFDQHQDISLFSLW